MSVYGEIQVFDAVGVEQVPGVSSCASGTEYTVKETRAYKWAVVA